MKLLKVLTIAFCMIFAPLSFTQSGGAGGSSASGAAGSLSSGVIAAIAAAVLAVAAIVDAQDGDKVAKPNLFLHRRRRRGRRRRGSGRRGRS